MEERTLEQNIDPVLVIPDERISYSFCRPIAPLVFELGLELGQAFAPVADPTTDIPYFIRMRTKDSDPNDSRVRWPSHMHGKLPMRRIRELPKSFKLKSAPNFGKLALESGSLRYGVQKAILDWIFPAFYLGVYYTVGTVDPDKNGVWRVSTSFGFEPLNQWDAKNDIRQNLLERTRPHAA